MRQCSMRIYRVGCGCAGPLDALPPSQKPNSHRPRHGGSTTILRNQRPGVSRADAVGAWTDPHSGIASASSTRVVAERRVGAARETSRPAREIRCGAAGFLEPALRPRRSLCRAREKLDAGRSMVRLDASDCAVTYKAATTHVADGDDLTATFTAWTAEWRCEQKAARERRAGQGGYNN